MNRAIFRPAAAADVEAACRWYDEQRPDLGGEFLAELDTTVKLIQAHPGQYPVLHRATRRALLRRFPYGLYYRVQQDLIIVVACMHAHRDPKRWRHRR